MMRGFLATGIIALAATASLATVSVAAGRPEADIARDADRKPAEMISFAGIKSGQTVVDMLPGGGYFTRVFSTAVGSKGKVIALIPTSQAERRPEGVAKMKALAGEPGNGNVTVSVSPLSTIAPPNSVNVVFTAQNYHDLHNPALPADTLAGVNKAVFAALKPGGVYIVVDHSAAKGSGLRDVNTLHRIDPAFVKAEVLKAGFTFDGESKALTNPADDRKAAVFDPALRGHTDQFVFRFRKPG
jgi:predicted methyltransferase